MAEVKIGHAGAAPESAWPVKPNPEVSTAFKTMSFFLDLRDYADITKLANDIRSLGGTVEVFLSRDVKYVVTNRASLKKAIDRHQTSNTSSILSCRSFSPASLSLSSTSSNQEWADQRLNQHPNSRAGLLVERALHTNVMANNGRDFLQLARMWGVKVVHVTVLTEWIRKLLSNHTKKKIEENMCNKKQCIRLSTPFLKYEDVDRRFAPQYCQFTSWPTVRLDNGHISDVTSPVAVRKLPKRVLKVPVLRDRPTKRGFCEICSAVYTNIDDHMETSRHRAFVENESNFARLDEKISKLPSPEEFCRRVMASGEGPCRAFPDDLRTSPSPSKVVGASCRSGNRHFY